MDFFEEYEPDEEEEVGSINSGDTMKKYAYIFLGVIVAYVVFVGIISEIFTRTADRRKDKKKKPTNSKTVNMTHKITNPDIIYRKNL